MAHIEELSKIVGADHVLSGEAAAGYSHDWVKMYEWSPLLVVRPANTKEVSEIVKYANRAEVPIVPVSGNTGLAGGTRADGAIMLSLERLNRIREIRPDARIAIVEAGVILANVHTEADAHDFIFPLTFGAKGSAMVGGFLSTNAGGSNVLRYGNTRDLVLGIEAVMPNGEIMEIMSELHKDNSGYNLKHLLIGAEGTLGIITAAVLKLMPKPKAYATAMVAAPSLDDALKLLNRLQAATGGAVEAFEYMPRLYIERHLAQFENARAPFEERYDVNIMVEVGTTIASLAAEDDSGKVRLVAEFEETLGALMEEGAILDAVVAQNEAQRVEMWQRREAAAEISMSYRPLINNDIAVPLDRVATFLERADAGIKTVDEGAQALVVSHLGDGNVHYSVWPKKTDPEDMDKIMELIEEIALDLGGSFSAEHGIGMSKKPSMRRRKNPVAIGVMRQIKAALDPKNILNPGKVLPDQ